MYPKENMIVSLLITPVYLFWCVVSQYQRVKGSDSLRFDVYTTPTYPPPPRIPSCARNCI